VAAGVPREPRLWSGPASAEIRAGAVSGSCKWGRPAPRGLPGGAVPGDL